MRKEGKKIQILFLEWVGAKASRYNKRLTYLKNQKSKTYNKFRKKKDKMKGNHQTTKRKAKEQRRSIESIGKQSLKRQYILSIITLNVNELNDTIKIIEWQTGLKKQEPMIWCLQEAHFKAKYTHKLKVRRWKKIFHTNGNDKKVGAATHTQQNRL